ncbi:butyrate kinase [Pontibacillus litoralis]|uniref:Probable butyrate kinase n=1 Tax=Pontibacillus litoralis JSM 072002 TaxID=1385512 RepID=A0A0A5G992_9BACI|nr:butyrate kinase [Pontibacillus litoralis]KGX87748.1 butyrate kinase [Pontibacillus litoralis JSM 072002]
MKHRVLAINPGATSTKVACYENDELTFKKEFTYHYETISQYDSIMQQYHLRYQDIATFLQEMDMKIGSFDAVVGRGGLLPPVKAGAYRVNEAMLDCLEHRPVLQHASNLGASLAKGIAEVFGTEDCQAFIYDPVTVDQMEDVARISGSASIERKSIGHVLNMRAVSMKIADEQLGKPYEESRLVVAHIGGGSSASAHRNGRIIDLVSDDEGLFSTERSGGLPLKEIIPMCFQRTQKEMTELTRKKGGLVSYFGTNDARIVEEKAKNGDEQAQLILRAMAYQIAKTIGELATVLCGKVDAIILTGGLAYSEYVMNMVKERVSFLAPVHIVPGEEELLALAKGARRVLTGQEHAHTFIENEAIVASK